jgi:hypothetical protein
LRNLHLGNGKIQLLRRSPAVSSVRDGRTDTPEGVRGRTGKDARVSIVRPCKSKKKKKCMTEQEKEVASLRPTAGAPPQHAIPLNLLITERNSSNFSISAQRERSGYNEAWPVQFSRRFGGTCRPCLQSRTISRARHKHEAGFCFLVWRIRRPFMITP